MDRLELARKEAELLEAGTPYAAVTIVHSAGTARTEGKMLVLPDETIYGTVGGGAGEQRAERRICPLVGMTIAPQTPAKICADPPQKNAGRLLQDNINTREINAGARARENGDVLSILLNGFPDGCGERLRQALKDFAAARAAGKHPLTARAAKLVCSTLQRLADEAGVRDRYGYMAAVLEQSILRGWEGLFPLKDDFVDKAPAQRPANTADRPREIGPDTDITDFL